MTNYLVVLCTCPNKTSAMELAHKLITKHLTACVNIIENIFSVYCWQGKIESATEQLLLIKTQQDHYPALQQTILASHPYETPEIIALPIEQGFENYLAWLSQSLAKADSI